MRLSLVATALVASTRAFAQVPAEWRDSLVFHTFSIAAIDPRTGEVGVAVTTRVPCVGNGVPWVRKGIGAVATQASTRTEWRREKRKKVVSPTEMAAMGHHGERPNGKSRFSKVFSTFCGASFFN
jgi:hypothetical protein